ncbi:hypothetical protein NLG97_g5428 [Lecanicillium saksenae]|uniref:Uncharacterized protein n=1 Tax=Lecanicillium saksenae TaxID=468837 RepID=A0ACC1QVP3_9HYPO|nr:hypothetical protein NLG97_g5428 [Lecanicillium saksenae]
MSQAKQTPTRPPLIKERYELLGHVSLGVSSYEKAKLFYDAIMTALGGHCMFENAREGVLGYGPAWNPEAEPLNIFERPNSAPAGQGFHLAFNAPSRESVRQFWESAMQHGGTDEGKWGPRKEYGKYYYAAFVRDPDGNKLEAVFQDVHEENAEDELKFTLMRSILRRWDERNDADRAGLSNTLKSMSTVELQEKLDKMF